MDIDSILDDDNLDIEILEVKVNNTNSAIKTKPALKQKALKTNPVEEHLLKQLQCVDNQICRTQNNIELIEMVTKTKLKKLTTQNNYREDISSDSDSDLYSSTGEPCKQEKRNKFYQKHKVIKVQDIWQRVIDNKWIIGLHIRSTTSCLLKDPMIYCSATNNDVCNGISVFWSLTDGTLWYPTDEIDSEEEVVGTVAIDLPSFEDKAELQIQGVVTCEFDDKIFQSEVFCIALNIDDMVAGDWNVNFSPDSALASVLALKAFSTDRLILLPVESDSNMGKRLMKFLDKYEFKEIHRVCLVKKTGSLQYCLLEVLPTEGVDVRIVVSARSEAQLSLLIQLMQRDFPEMIDIEKQEYLEEAAEALREELELYLNCNDPYKLQEARLKTDLLIP